MMSEDGKETLTWEEFLNASKLLEKLSENLQVSWTLHHHEGKSDCFLKHISYRPYDHSTDNSTFDEEFSFSEESAKTELTSGNEKTDYLLRYGSRLTLDQVWSMFLGRKMKTMKEEGSMNMDMWGTLSQQDHPILHLPFFTLHPCHTSNVMRSLWNNKKNPPLSYLITWLSIVGGELGLSVANELGQHLVSCGEDTSLSHDTS